MRARGLEVRQVAAHAEAPEARRGTFMPPTLIHLRELSQLEHEVFGPVLHVLPFRRAELDQVVDGINALGYGLTLGIHSRVDQTIDRIIARARVGNVYVNRNIVGAVVGVQPFGGEGLSGTGPKAGGPLYLHRLLAKCPPDAALEELRGPDGGIPRTAPLPPAFESLRAWAAAEHGEEALAFLCDRLAALTPVGITQALPGPTGERNTYSVMGREVVLCLADAERDVLNQVAVVLAIGGRPLLPASDASRQHVARLPEPVRRALELAANWRDPSTRFDAVLHHGDRESLTEVLRVVASREGPIVGVHGFAPGEEALPIERLLIERVVSVNTAAAGGNASLMTIG
jgi:RHH-type transcriptional regulator, proline utilization regulon repressor / proline dehydrogenase / delta 1-pyrroline-5-carboxylate dehydrogenase